MIFYYICRPKKIVCVQMGIRIVFVCNMLFVSELSCCEFNISKMKSGKKCMLFSPKYYKKQLLSYTSIIIK